jgi:transposase-like protein
MREQRCWVHKTANVLAKLPKSQQPKAKRDLQEIWMAETKVEAFAAFDTFIEAYAPKYEKATACLEKDRDALLAFYDFPAEHWKHLRTTNPIESTFATVRHRTIRSKGCLSNKTALARRASAAALAPPRRSRPVAKDHSGCEVQGWNRGRCEFGRRAQKRRRLTGQAVTKNRR